jgi:hypothetical protein
VSVCQLSEADQRFPKYDRKSDRCYIEQFRHVRVGPHKDSDIQHRSLIDARTDDLLAVAKIEDGKKEGMVLDPDHKTPTDAVSGWDDANTYIDEMMAEQRR